MNSGTGERAAIRLVPATVALLDAAIAGDAALGEALGCPVVPGWASFREALPVVRAAVAADGDRWGPRLILAGEPPELVGWGGFKGPPSSGAVEIGYEIAEGCQGRGLATAAARAMVAEAFAAPAVRAVTAHTLPEPNASNRVLTKVGFQHRGSDVEEGQTTWRYELLRP